MMAAVAEDTAPAEEIATSHRALVEESRSNADNQYEKQDQQPSFCEANNTTTVETETEPETETISHYTDIEDDTFDKNNDSNDNTDSGNNSDNDNDNDNGTSSYWDLLITLYLPLILMWFRRSMFGPANLIRSIVVGQLMRLVFVENTSEWICEKLPPWLQVLLFQCQSSAATSGTGGHVSTVLGVGSGKIDPHAWPPPAFTALALLTIFALVVHPDGLTWIILGKIRDAISAVFSALAQCLEFLVNDFGVFPTIIAAITLATMVFLVFVVLRTLSPKSRRLVNNSNNNNMHNNERKKKKKKGGSNRHRREHHHHHHQSIRLKHSSQSQSHPGMVENSSTEETPSSPMPSQPPSELHNDASSSSSSSLNTATTDSHIHVPSLSSSLSTAATNMNGNEIIKQTTTTTNNMSMMSLGTANNKSTRIDPAAAKDNRNRRRMMSNSTLDTTPLADDQSCGSTSVRSYPSVSVNSNRSGGGNNNNNSKTSNNKGSAGSTTPRRGKRPGTAVKSPKNVDRSSTGMKNKSAAMVPSPVVESSSVSSRWDALKPEHSSSNSNNNTYNHHHHANGNNTINKKHHHYQQQQQQHQRHHRVNVRRGGPGVNGNNGPSRKGQRQNQSSVNNEQLMIGRNNPAVTISGSASSSSSSVHHDFRSSKITEVLKTIDSTRQQHDNFVTSSTTSATISPVLNSYTTSPRPNNSMPPPPPGFQSVFIMSGLEERKVDKYQQSHKNNDLTVPTLFDTPPVIRSSYEQQQINSSRAVMAMSSSPQRAATVIAPDFFPSSASLVPSYGGSSNGCTITGTMIQENPFSSNINATSTTTTTSNNINMSLRHQENLDSQIEADLQELGGQMAGSILDF